MKMTSVFFLALLLLTHGVSFARTSKDERDLQLSAKELTYSGQLEKARKMIEKNLETGDTRASSWNITTLVLSIFWGAIGAGFFMYGRKQTKALFLLCGIGLCLLPMFVSDSLTSLILGLVMCAAPFKFKL